MKFLLGLLTGLILAGSVAVAQSPDLAATQLFGLPSLNMAIDSHGKQYQLFNPQSLRNTSRPSLLRPLRQKGPC